MSTLLYHAISLIVGLICGGWLGYRYGARVVKDVQLAKSAIKQGGI